MILKRRFITASTGTVLLQEYQPVFCAWKTVVFLKDGDKKSRTATAEAWVAETPAEKIYEIVDTRTAAVVATAVSPDAAKLKKMAFTRALIKPLAGKGIFQVRVRAT
jgi:hypothetical protein